MNKRNYKIFGINIYANNYNNLLAELNDSLNSSKQTLVTYANFYSLNNVYTDEKTNSLFNEFSLIHSDGIGTYIALKLIYSSIPISNINGSDFYPLLIELLKKNKKRMFLIGDTNETVSLLKEKYGADIFAGAENGYKKNYEETINLINKADVSVLFVGMGSPKQEEWVLENKEQLNVPLIICCGEGIKSIAGNKVRGPKFIRAIGLEWLVRLFSNPLYFWKRYLIGIPLFLFRIIKEKRKK